MSRPRRSPRTALLRLILLAFSSTSGCSASPGATGGPLRFPGVSNISVLLLDPSSGTLYVGARDTVLALDATSLSHRYDPIDWTVPQNDTKDCVSKGKNEDDCHNYICLLELEGKGRIYVCGSYAYNPQCTFINMSNFSLLRRNDGAIATESGIGKCPFDPTLRHSAVMADGVLYSAAPRNFLGTISSISRATGSDPSHLLTNEPKWIHKPEFVSAVFVRENGSSPTADDDKIYFFFTEVAQEYALYREVKVARVARVCKEDIGGHNVLQKHWTTFLKAQLVCEDHASKRRYDILSDVYAVQQEPGQPGSTHFYGVFSSQWGYEVESAVCVFSVVDITRTLSGSFKKTSSCVNPQGKVEPPPGQCLSRSLKAQGVRSSRQLADSTLMFIRDCPLKERSVTAAPLLVRRGTAYTKITVAVTRDTTGSPVGAVVLHLGSDRGELHVVSVLDEAVHLLQEVSLFPAQEPVNNILLHEGHALVSSSSFLSRVPAEGCGLFPSCALCVQASKGSCEWRHSQRVCSPAPDGLFLVPTVEDALTQCDAQARCTPAEQLVRVGAGLRVVLPCGQLSPGPCHWDRPPRSHTRQLSTDLAVTVTGDSVGIYTCICQQGASPCPRASFRLMLEGPGNMGGAEGGVLGGASVGVLVGFLLAGLVLGLIHKKCPSWGRGFPFTRQPLNEADLLSEKGGGTGTVSPTQEPGNTKGVQLESRY